MPETPVIGRMAKAFGVPDTERLERELRERLDKLIEIGKQQLADSAETNAHLRDMINILWKGKRDGD